LGFAAAVWLIDIGHPVYRLALQPPMRTAPPFTPGRSSRRTPIAVLLATALLVGACGGSAPSATPTAPAVTPAVTPIVGAAAAPVEIALAQASPAPVASTAPVASVVPAVASSVPGSPLPSTVPVPEAVFPAELAARLDRIVTASQARIPAPGISVAVRLADGSLYTGVAGDRQLSPRKPVDPDTVFAIASITKTFVTATVMQLVDEGKLSLDDRLARHVPDFPNAKNITIRQLLGHTSGLFDYFQNPAYARQVFANPARSWTPRQILKFVQAPVCAPGSCFRYSNTNFVLLGLVVESVTGKDLSAVIRKRLLDPLGMEHTVFQPDEATPRDAAHGHLWGGGSTFYDQTGRSRVLPHQSASTVAWAAGAMASTPTDLATWASALYGGEVVSDEALAEMLTFRKRDEYGLGTRTRDFAGRTAVGHLGGIRGYELAMWHFPEDGATIVVFTNRGLFSTDKTVKLLAKAVFGYLDEQAPAASPGPSGAPLPSPSVAPAG
jgi:D-alanyl-D-alanine carboxypeptidase